jgi:hypothetical protein
VSRATLLPTPGDPFLIRYWLANFAHWRPHAGRLYVQVSWPQPREVLERIRAEVMAVAGDSVVLDPPLQGRLDHGQAMHTLLDAVDDDDVVCFMEDDLHVLNAAFVERCFQTVEQGIAEVVGSPRGSMSHELIWARKSDCGRPGLWPHLLFGRRETFESLEEPFTARIWQPGERVLGLDHTCAELASADTFCAAAIELRAKASLAGIETSGPWAWELSGPTMHIGSLSTGPLPHDGRPSVPDDNWGPRVAWWRRAARDWPGGLDELHAAYSTEVERLAAAIPSAVAEAEKLFGERVS